uniref:Adaptin_N domain-containing protein n=1 Tax=Schistocephalus solidus TaxID=70667 RepID=A0A183TGZ7_SCHSO
LRETILPSALAWLRDPTWAVRDCACRTLARLLRSCPSAAKDAIMGTGGGATGGGQANTAGSGTTNSTAASPVGVSSGNAATGGSTIASSLPASSPLSGGSAGDAAATPASLSASVPSDAVATGAAGVANCTSGMSIASLTATAMARGLRALASDSNYHLRQIFILAVQRTTLKLFSGCFDAGIHKSGGDRVDAAQVCSLYMEADLPSIYHTPVDAGVARLHLVGAIVTSIRGHCCLTPSPENNRPMPSFDKVPSRDSDDQNLFGPGIPDEPVYCALGDSAPHAGLILPATQSLYKHVSAQSQNAAAAPPAPSTTGDPTSASPPPNCSPPPTMPAATLQTCLQLLLQLLSEDPVPNVRFAAARALLLISGSIDQKSAQKQLLPALKKVVESDPDVDVRYFAQDALSGGPVCGLSRKWASGPIPPLRSVCVLLAAPPPHCHMFKRVSGQW